MRALLSIHHRLDADSGAPGATLALGGALRERGEEVEYLSFDDMPVRLPFLASSVAYPPFAAARMAAAARRGTEVIDASTGDAWLWARLRRRAQTALITRSHGLEHLFQARERERVEREGGRMSWRYPLYWGGWRLHEVASSLRGSDLVLVLSEEEREYAAERLGVARERLRVTANGIPSAFLEAAAAPAAEAAGPGVAMIGAHRPSKGIDYGTDALATALAADPALRVSFLGSGSDDAGCRARFPEELRARVSNRPSFARMELPQLLRGHAIALAPSFTEGFSLALVEAMAGGLAPVASDIPAHREIVSDGVNGVLVPPGDGAAAGEAILGLRRDPPQLAAMREAARATAAGYTWERIAAATSAFYQEAAERRRAALRGAGR